MNKLTCSKCRVSMSVKMFYLRSDSTTGYRGQCIECTKKGAKNWRDKHPDKVYEMSKAYVKKYPKRVRKYANDFRHKYPDRIKKQRDKHVEKYPEKIKARSAVGNALRYGKLKRLPCCVCGQKKSQAHHESYDGKDMLNVVWYCIKHHRERHIEIEKELKEMEILK